MGGRVGHDLGRGGVLRGRLEELGLRWDVRMGSGQWGMMGKYITLEVYHTSNRL